MADRVLRLSMENQSGETIAFVDYELAGELGPATPAPGFELQVRAPLDVLISNSRARLRVLNGAAQVFHPLNRGRIRAERELDK
jgi:hypothetical protein